MKFPPQEKIVMDDGQITIVRHGKVIMRLAKGEVFNGSRISKNGKWATCEKCKTRHSIGLRCARCKK